MKINESRFKSASLDPARYQGNFIMEALSAFLATNGVAVLLFGSLVGLVLARNLHQGKVSEHWHLLHAGGTSRGILLLALAATVNITELSFSSLAWASGLVVLFVWTSVVAMFLRALSEERGFYPKGSRANRAIFLLYAIGTIALSVGLLWLALGFLKAWI
jgi:hypothetical protein